VPRTKKPAGTAVDRRNGRKVTELRPVEGGKIDAPAGLSADVLVLWDAYWDDAASGVQTPADRGVLLRWITEYDRYLRLIAEADKQPLVFGSQGQSVANPLYKLADRALAAAERCEKQMGVGALNRSNLGIAVISEQKSLAQMNAKYGGGDADGSPTAPPQSRPDPRVIEGTAR
jgi:P27 family predicted phage terminase small subunit